MFTESALNRQAEPNELPQGWRWVPLGSIAFVDKQLVRPNTEDAKRLPYLSLEHVESNSGRILKNPSKKQEDEGHSTTYKFTAKHVLYGKLRPYLNKVAEPNFNGRCTTELVPFLPKKEVDKSFLSFVLRRKEIIDAAMRGKTGARMPRADMNELLKELIPLPPLPEQKRIAANLTKQLAAVEQARKASEARLEAARALSAAYLREVFETKGKTLPDGWRWVRLECLVQCFSGAWGQDTQFNNCIALPVVGTSNISNEGNLSVDNAPTRFLHEKESGAIVKEGNLMVVKSSGSASNIRSGKTAICPPDLSGKLACSNFVMRLVPDSKVVVPYILWLVLNSDYVKRFIRQIAGSSTYPNIKWSLYKNLEIPLPPLPEQKQIAADLTGKLASVEQIKNTATEQSSAIESLPASLLRQAFSGAI